MIPLEDNLNLILFFYDRTKFITLPLFFMHQHTFLKPIDLSGRVIVSKLEACVVLNLRW